MVRAADELDAELAWRGRLGMGQAAASLFWRRDPGHVANMRDDKGVALRWSALQVQLGAWRSDTVADTPVSAAARLATDGQGAAPGSLLPMRVPEAKG